MKPRLTILLLLLIAITLAAGCGGPDQKKMKFFNKGKLLFEKGDYMKARLEFKNAAQIDPKFADAFYMLGMSAMATGNLNEAYGSLSAAVGLKPDHLKARAELAAVLLRGRAFDRAIETADIVLKAEPGNEQALVVKATALLEKKEAEAARMLMRELVAKGSKRPDVYLVLSAACMAKGDLPAAEDTLKKGARVIPGSSLLHVALAEVLVKNKRLDEAIAAMQQAVVLEPGTPALRLGLAGLYWDTNHEDKARAILKEICDGDSKNGDGRLMAARFYLQRRKVSDAEETLTAGIRKFGQNIRLRLALSEIYQGTSRTDLAQKTLKECLGLNKDAANPDIVFAKNALAVSCLSRGELDEAAKYTDEVLKAAPKNIDAHFARGNIYLMKKQWSGAVPEFRTIVTEKPQFIPAYVRMAEAHAMNNEPNLATDVLLNALKADPKSREAGIALARLYASQKEYGKAEAQLQKMVQENPGDLALRGELGDFFAVKGEPGRAEAAYRQIEKLAPGNPGAYAKLGAFFARQNRLDKAGPEFERALKLAPDSQQILSSAVEVYVAQKKYGAAATLCENTIKRPGNDGTAYNLLGQVYGSQGNFKKAEAAFTRAMELHPAWSAPLDGLTRLYVAQGRTATAVQKLEERLKTQPNSKVVRLLLAQLYSRTKDYGKAIPIYEKLVQEEPENWSLTNDLAFLLAEKDTSKKDLERARSLAQKALNARPDEPTVQDTLGWIYYRQGDTDRASDLIQKACAKMGRSPAVNYHMGMVSYKAGRMAQAKDYLARAIKSGENFDGRDEAQNLLGKL